jgi:hypothetical protein
MIRREMLQSGLASLAALPTVGIWFRQKPELQRCYVIRWIPVRERLPEFICGECKSNTVLTIDDKGLICTGNRVYHNRYKVGENPCWCRSTISYYNDGRLANVTHWAELPEPPLKEPN